MQKKLKQLNQETKIRTPMRNDPPWALRFSPTAWAKLLYFRDQSENEVGGFGITPADDLLYVQEFVAAKQKVTFASVRFDDEAVADYFDQQVDLGRQPQQFARIWCHTHPGDCPKPSMTDEDTFQRVFGNCDFSIMCIVAQGNQSYARISFNVGPTLFNWLQSQDLDARCPCTRPRSPCKCRPGSVEAQGVVCPGAGTSRRRAASVLTLQPTALPQPLGSWQRGSKGRGWPWQLGEINWMFCLMYWRQSDD